jgi:serine protease AprX
VVATHKIQRLIAPVLAAATLLGATAVTPIAASASTPSVVSLDSKYKVHPLLQYGAKTDPARLVKVIVQKTRNDVKLDTIIPTLSLVTRLAGVQVVEEFKAIPAFAAVVPQAAVYLLAANPNVRYISPDGAVQVVPDLSLSALKPAPKPPAPKPVPQSKTGIDARNLLTTYPFEVGATAAWSATDGSVETGSNIAIAVIDSGIDASHPDLANQVLAVNVNRNSTSPADGYGHGTHVAGIVNGHDASQQYLGVAPNATLISIKVADDTGAAYESDLLRGLDWVYMNRGGYKIRALNLSVSVSVPESYATSPVDAAVERLWNDGVTVVASAGNLGSAQDAVWYAPGNDPYIITVGCVDDNGTVPTDDDSLCPISSRGVTEDGFAKPDLVAPGRKIVSALANGVGSQGPVLAGEFPDRIMPDGNHIRLSGTSMSAPMVTAAVALLLDRHGALTPNQIKQLLVGTARSYPGQPDQAGLLNVVGAMSASDHPPAARDQIILPVTGVVPPTGTVTMVWDGARWGSTYFDGARWGSAYWDGARWGNAEWDGARWGSAYWDGARWGSSASFDGARWGSAEWDGARWGSSANYD